MSGDGPTVIVVEDDAAHRHLLELCLETAGYRVRCASTAREAAALIGTEPTAALLLTDYHLGSAEGTHLVMLVRQARPGMACLVVTGQNGLEPWATEHDVPMLMKPYKVRDLVEMVASLVGPAAPVTQIPGLSRAG